MSVPSERAGPTLQMRRRSSKRLVGLGLAIALTAGLAIEHTVQSSHNFDAVDKQASELKLRAAGEVLFETKEGNLHPPLGYVTQRPVIGVVLLGASANHIVSERLRKIGYKPEPHHAGEGTEWTRSPTDDVTVFMLAKGYAFSSNKKLSIPSRMPRKGALVEVTQ